MVLSLLAQICISGMSDYRDRPLELTSFAVLNITWMVVLSNNHLQIGLTVSRWCYERGLLIVWKMSYLRR